MSLSLEDPRVKQFLNRYVSKKTRAYYRSALKRIIEGNYEGLSDSSMRVIIGIAGAAKKFGLPVTVPVTHKKMILQTRRYMLPKEIRRVFVRLKRFHQSFLLLLSTGARPSELLKENIVESKPPILVVRGKVGTRLVLVTSLAEKILGIGPTIYHLEAEPYKVWREFRRAGKKAGIPMYPYRLRHTFGFVMKQLLGVEIAAMLMGHSNINTTARYGRVGLELAIKRTVEVLDRVDINKLFE